MSKGLFRPKNYAAKFFSFRSHRLSKLLFSTIVALVSHFDRACSRTVARQSR